MKITSLSDAPKVPANLEGYIVHTSATLDVIHLCLHPGQVIDQHPNPVDVVACLIEGEVTLNMGESSINLSLHDVAEIEKEVERGFTNTGLKNARILIMKKK